MRHCTQSQKFNGSGSKLNLHLRSIVLVHLKENFTLVR